MLQSQTHTSTDTTISEILPSLLEGYRFRFCETPEDVLKALAVRREVYNGSSGYQVPIPDELDLRSWILIAEDEATGEVVGTMRLTPRFAGKLECEDYFDLPAHLRSDASYELNRFAILPAYRKGKTFIPQVSLGLFKLVCDFLAQVNAKYMVIASKAERLWTYEWMGFRRTGLVAPYGKLEHADHELLWHDYAVDFVQDRLADHPFHAFFTKTEYAEVELPKGRLPALDLVAETVEPLRIAVGA